MKHTELNTEEVKAALAAGKEVQTAWRSEEIWHDFVLSGINTNTHKYRLVEETPEPQQGDMVEVRDKGKCWRPELERFVGVKNNGTYACESKGGGLISWDEIRKPTEPEHVAREGWTPKRAIYVSLDEAHKRYGWAEKNLVRVREII